jgi:hypothetical protein
MGKTVLTIMLNTNLIETTLQKHVNRHDIYTRLHKEKHRKKRNASLFFHKNHIKTAHEAHFDKICAEMEKVSFLTFIRTSCSGKLIANYLEKKEIPM